MSQTHDLARSSLAQTAIIENRALFMIFGLSLVVLGFVAIGFPFLTAIAAKTFLGWNA